MPGRGNSAGEGRAAGTVRKGAPVMRLGGWTGSRCQSEQVLAEGAWMV